jgi:lysophospholipase L1-like esterase
MAIRNNRTDVMGWVLRSLLSLAVLAIVLTSAGDAGAKDKPVYYLALGDSLSVGVQPNAPTPSGETDEGYADQLVAALRVQNPDLRLVKLSCGGESTGTMLGVGEGCDPRAKRYPHGTQLAEAVAFLRAHRSHTALVTIDVGANDRFCLLALDRDCFDEGMARIRRNLASILSVLREAAGPEVPIVAMNYYNPFVVFWFEDPGYAMTVNDLFLEFNATLQEVYADFDVPVADVAGAFATADFSLDPETGVPVNVERACAWTWICAPPPFGPDIHPNASGYGVIARAFLDVLPELAEAPSIISGGSEPQDPARPAPSAGSVVEMTAAGGMAMKRG